MTKATPHMSADEVGQAIRQAREAKGYSLRELSQRSGVDHSYIGYVEKGQIESPGAGKLQQLAEALEIDLEDLYGLAGYTAPSSLPGLPAYLRTKYDLPAAAAERVEKYLARLQKEHARDEQRGDT